MLFKKRQNQTINATFKVLTMCKCQSLETPLKNALNVLGSDLEIEVIMDLEKIAKYHSAELPAIVYQDQIIISGKSVVQEEIIRVLKDLNF